MKERNLDWNLPSTDTAFASPKKTETLILTSHPWIQRSLFLNLVSLSWLSSRRRTTKSMPALRSLCKFSTVFLTRTVQVSPPRNWYTLHIFFDRFCFFRSSWEPKYLSDSHRHPHALRGVSCSLECHASLYLFALLCLSWVLSVVTPFISIRLCLILLLSVSHLTILPCLLAPHFRTTNNRSFFSFTDTSSKCFQSWMLPTFKFLSSGF